MATKLKVNYEFVGDSTTPVTRTNSIKHGDDMLNNVVTNMTTMIGTKADLTSVTKVYDSVLNMKNDTTLTSGTKCRTLGYYSPNDGGGAFYTISSTSYGFSETLSNNLYAVLYVDTVLNVKQCGIKGNYEVNSESVVNKISQYLADNCYSSVQYAVDMYYMNNLKLYFPKDHYKLNFSTSANGFNIIGNNSIIDGSGSTAITLSGHRINVFGLTFVNCEKAIVYNGSNIEAGWFNVIDSQFIRTSGDAIQINGLQSYTGTIERCFFFQCKHTLNVTHYADHMTIKDCWISVKPMTENYDASILFSDIGELYIDKCLFVPTGYSADNIICGYIKCSGNCTITDSHFGGEPGSLPIIITDVKSEHLTNGYFTIKNCPQSYSQNNGRAVIIIKSTFNRIEIDDCIGFAEVQKPVRFVSGYSPEDVHYGSIILTNLRGNTCPPFDYKRGFFYQNGCKYLQKELYPFLICDDHIINQAINVEFEGLTIKGFNNEIYQHFYPYREGIIYALVKYKELNSTSEKWYKTLSKVIEITCFKNQDQMIYETNDEHITIQNNAIDTQDTNITLVPSSSCGELTIKKVWSSTSSNEDETLLFPDMY